MFYKLRKNVLTYFSADNVFFKKIFKGVAWNQKNLILLEVILLHGVWSKPLVNYWRNAYRWGELPLKMLIYFEQVQYSSDKSNELSSIQ